jgi:ribosome-associated translation inhibitor RaiA
VAHQGRKKGPFHEQLNPTRETVMRTEITSPHWPVTTALAGHIQARVDHLDARSGDRVRSLTVHLADVNGPKGGEDKVCHLLARIDCHPSINIEGRHTDLYLAISLAVRRMERSLGEVLDERRTRNPKSRHNDRSLQPPEESGPPEGSHAERAEP